MRVSLARGQMIKAAPAHAGTAFSPGNKCSRESVRTLIAIRATPMIVGSSFFHRLTDFRSGGRNTSNAPSASSHARRWARKKADFGSVPVRCERRHDDLDRLSFFV